jgi:hypothetical protein
VRVTTPWLVIKDKEGRCSLCPNAKFIAGADNVKVCLMKQFEAHCRKFHPSSLKTADQEGSAPANDQDRHCFNREEQFKPSSIGSVRPDNFFNTSTSAYRPRSFRLATTCKSRSLGLLRPPLPHSSSVTGEILICAREHQCYYSATFLMH